jgi:outer membrane protein OmpU
LQTRHIGVLENNEKSRTANLGGMHPTGALYRYSMDGLRLSAGISQIESGNQFYSLGARYNFGDYAVAAGYEKIEDFQHILISGSVKYDNITTRGFVGRAFEKGNGHDTQFGADLSAKFDEVTVLGRAKLDFDESRHFGLGVTYDLGGGATFGASVNHITHTGASDLTKMDMGVAFRF